MFNFVAITRHNTIVLPCDQHTQKYWVTFMSGEYFKVAFLMHSLMSHNAALKKSSILFSQYWQHRPVQ